MVDYIFQWKNRNNDTQKSKTKMIEHGTKNGMEKKNGTKNQINKQINI